MSRYLKSNEVISSFIAEKSQINLKNCTTDSTDYHRLIYDI